MKHRITFIFLFIALSAASFAQNTVPKEKMTREEKDEKNQARLSRINAKNEYAIFKRDIVASKEFNDEKRKIPKLQSENKGAIVKVVVAIDSLDEGDTTTKVLTGYIVQNIGDNAMLVYDITFDRAQKKILTMKKTQEAIDAEADAKEEKTEKATDKKPGAKPTVHKKTGDDDDDEPEEKPTKKEKDED